MRVAAIRTNLKYSNRPHKRKRGEAVTSKTAPRALKQDIIKALAHPSRVHALHILNQRVASPKELANEVGTSVGKMAYHVRELDKAGYIELVSTEPRRGATEHFYRAIKRAVFSDEEWAQVPEPVRNSIVGMELGATGKLISESIRSGSFERRDNRHHSLHEGMVDEQGWDEAMALLEETMEKLSEIQAVSAERRIESEEAGIPIAVSLIGFERANEASSAFSADL
jgi:DNA-binding transcriptional ArsR family regulator